MKRKLFLLLCALLTMIGVTQVKAYTTADLTTAGWTKITSISQSEIANNYYVFLSEDESLILRLENSSNQSNYAAFYRDLDNPFADGFKVWTLEANGENYGMRNLEMNARQMQTEWSGSSNDLRWRTNDQTASISWTGLSLAYAESLWTLTSTQYNRPLGIYNNTTGTPAAGNEIGANDSGKGQKFNIYAIAKSAYWAKAGENASESNPANFTGCISNPEIYNGNKGNLPRGWSEDTSIRKTGNNNRTAGTGLTELEGWSGGDLVVNYYQTISNLPGGKYRLKATGGDSNGSGNGQIYITGTSATESVAIAENATTASVLSAGSVTIGLSANGTNSWVHAKNFKLEYLGIDLSDLVATKNALKTSAEDLGQSSEKMSDAARTALGTAAGHAAVVDETSKTALEAVIAELNTAIANANTSIASYATIAAGSVPDDKLDGWVCENTNTFHINTWSHEGDPGNDPSGMVTPFIENWVAKGAFLGAGKVYYQLQGLNPGEVYYAQALVRSYNEANADAPNGPNFFINDKVVDMTDEGTTFTYNNMSGIYATLGGAATVGEDGVLKLGVEIANDRNYNWVAFKSISIRPMQDALDAARDAANAQVGKKMNNDVAHALALALETYGTGTPTTAEEYEVAIAALSNATIAAENSVANYQEAATILNAASSLDAAGQASYTTNETVATIQSAYDNGTLVSVTSEQKATCATALRTAAKAQTTPGADMTLAIINPSFETGNLEGWTSTDGGATANNNNWPAGKNGTYYVERWQPAADGSLSDGSLLQTINDLPAGRYRLTVNAQNIEQGNGDAHGTGYILKAGDKQVVVSESVENSVEITLQSAGNLEIGMVLNNCTGNWISCDHFRLTYVASPVDPTPYREAVAAKLTVAQGLVNEVMNANVETDLNNAIAATAGYEESFDIAALEQMAADLDAANAAAQTSVGNYQEAAAVLNAAATAGLDAAGQAAYAANETVLEIKAGYDNKTLVAVTEEQKTLCQAALKTAVKAQTTDGADWTLLIENPGFEGSYTSIANPNPNRDIYQPEGWTVVWENGDSNDMTSLNSSCTQWNDNFKNMPQPADGGNNVYWARYRWGSQSSLTLKQTILGLPAGVYEVGAEGYLSNATNGKATLSVNFGDEVAIVDFTAAAWTKKVVAFAINETQDVEILYNLTENAQVEIKAGVDNFTLTARSAASTEDYAALNAAIETAEGKTLGFEKDEFAPYNNIEALQALADAKAINQSVVNTKGFVQAATAALTYATWTANAEQLNAFFDGAFASDYSQEGNVMPIGWHGVGDKDNATNVRLMWNYGANPGLNATSSKQGAFLKFTGIYGNEAGYTLPLKAGAYKLSFIYGGWNEVGARDIKVYSAADASVEATVYPASVTAKDNQAHQKTDSWSSYDGYVVIPADGDYIFSFYRENTSAQNQLVFGDIELKKAPTYSANLKVADGKLGTFVAPFDVVLPQNVKGYRVASVTETEIKLALIAVGGNELTAGTPLIVYGDGADVDETFYGIPAETENVKAGSLYGILDVNNTTVPADAYVLQTQGGVQAFYKVAADAPGALNRCYVKTAVNNARLTITFEGEDPTAINAIEAAEAEEGTLKDGKYFIDNKIVIVKNGVKYGANGQILK